MLDETPSMNVVESIAQHARFRGIRTALIYPSHYASVRPGEQGGQTKPGIGRLAGQQDNPLHAIGCVI
jgi:hypothetical protein